MRDIEIMLGGLEQSYMQRLALHLKKKFSDALVVNICGCGTAGAAAAGPIRRIWIGSEEFAVSHAGPDRKVIILTDSEDKREECVFRYQHSDRLCREIEARIRKINGCIPKQAGTLQRWLVITSDGPPVLTAAFSVVCALLLAESGPVLHMNMGECTGQTLWAGDCSAFDLGDYIYGLRKDPQASPSGFACRIDGADMIMAPSNPMILQEMNRDDTLRILGSVREESGYEWVVAALVCPFAGCSELLKAADRVIHLSGKGYAQECAKKEWMRFFLQCREGSSEGILEAPVPELEEPAAGFSPVYEWVEGGAGRIARYLLRDWLREDESGEWTI